MAFLPQTMEESEVKKATLATLKKAYLSLLDTYKKIIEGDLIRCDCCGEFLSRTNFYKTNDNVIGVYQTCKKCILQKVEQRNKKTDKPNETKKSVMEQLHKMNLPYIDPLYESCCKSVKDEVNEKNRSSPFLQMVTILQSLPQYKNKKWEDSEFPVGVGINGEIDDSYEIKENQRTIKNGKKRFGPGYSNEDYMFLENEYQDWVQRYQCENKTQESIFERLAFKKWEIMKATRNGQPTKDLDRTYTDLLSSANLLPRQNVGNAATDSLTFGQLIEKWEQEDPIPEASEEFKDIDGIVKYIDVFFKGHLAKMMGLKNGYSHQYDEYMKQYTVTKPEYNEEEGSEAIFDALFGKEVE